MARTGPGSLLSRRNMKLDSFLKRTMERAVYERILASEPCVVISETFNKVYMHVVLSDERVYLTEYPPRTLTEAFSFRRVRDIELVNDLPDFLSGKDRERCQHVRVSYVTEKPARATHGWLRGDRGAGLRDEVPPSIKLTLAGYSAQRKHSEAGPAEIRVPAPTRSASCPNPETLGLPRIPHPPPRSPTPSFFSPSVSPAVSPSSPLSPVSGRAGRGQVPRRIGRVLSRLLRRDSVSAGVSGGVGGGVGGGVEREAELHLYAVAPTSRVYLHLQSSWNSFIIRSTMMLDPLYRGRSQASSLSSPGTRRPAISWERTSQLFAQLSSELLQDDVDLETLYLLLQELRTAAHRNVMLSRLFWRSSEVCVFLVQTLEESACGHQSLSGVYTTDQLLLRTLVVQTLAVMFRQTELDSARLSLLSDKKGALASRMLLALTCDPSSCCVADCEVSAARLSLKQREAEVTVVRPCCLQVLLAEYLDAACSLLFELLLLGHEATRCSSAGSCLSVGWILQVLQSHPHTTAFVGYQAQQVVLVLLQERFLGPCEAVLLYQRCRLLLACLQHDGLLSQHLRCHFREEFRYFVTLPCAEEKLPPHYPISRPTLRLLEQILAQIRALHR
ncbi:uncharacterized protein V6R79_006060 [Siganus canaliculatus]